MWCLPTPDPCPGCGNWESLPCAEDCPEVVKARHDGDPWCIQGDRLRSERGDYRRDSAGNIVRNPVTGNPLGTDTEMVRPSLAGAAVARAFRF